MEHLKLALTIVGLVLGLPAAVWGAYKLLRLLPIYRRKVLEEGADLESELNFLSAHQNYLQGLDRPLGYDEQEYTQLGGSVLGEETVPLRMVVRKSRSGDQPGLEASDIIPTSENRSVMSVLSVLRGTKRPIILLGEPGSGKSVTLRHLALDLTRRESARRRHLPLLPIYLQLGGYDQTKDGGEPVEDGGEPVEVKEFIRYQLEHVIPGGEAIAKNLETLLRQRRLVLLFDSMDEMPSKSFSDRVAKLKRFLEEFGGLNRIVVACRRREYRGDFPYTELIIEPFNPAKIRTYLDRNWEIYSRLLPAEAREESHAKYLELAKPEHPLAKLSANPFFLKLVTRYFFTQGGELPRQQADILRAYVGEKLERETERKALNKGERARLEAIWSASAWVMIEKNLGTYIHAPQAAAALATRGGFQAFQVEKALDLGVSSGLMRKEADGAVRFEHHRLLEYLAAYHWERHRADARVVRRTLENPWWRETLVLRAGVSDDPDALTREILDAIDPSYLDDLGQGGAEVAVDQALRRLDHLVAFEVALLCARSRWEELGDETRRMIFELSGAIVQNGTVLEQVRVVRALSGLPLSFSFPLLVQLAGSRSEWMVGEVFASLSPKERTGPEFGRIVESFLKSVPTADLLETMATYRGVPVTACLRSLLRQSPLRFVRIVGAGLLVWVAVIGGSLLLGSQLDPQALDPAHEVAGRSWKIPLLLGFPVIFCLFYAGWRATLGCVAAYGVSVLFLPPISAYRYFFCLVATFVYIGPDFQRGKWIRNPLKRALALFVRSGGFLRFIVLAFFAFATFVLIYHRTTGEPAPRLLAIGAGLFAGLAVHLTLSHFIKRKVRSILREADTQIDREQIERLAKSILDRLREPWPKALGKRLLNRYADLRLEEEVLIADLRGFMGEGQTFLDHEIFLETVERLDTRRRQKGLER